MKPVIAIVSTNRMKYSETFIHNHLLHLPFQSYYMFGGYLPQFWSLDLEGDFEKLKEPARLRVLGKSDTHLQQAAVRRFLKRKKVQLVLAEYGPSGVELMHVCKELKIPMIVHFHGYDAYRNDIIEFYSKSYLKLFQQARFVIGVSRHMCKQLLKLGASEDKLRYNPYGPDPSHFSPVDSSKNQLIYCGVARFADTKGHFLTIEAFQKVVQAFPEAKLYFAGDGPLLLSAITYAKALGVEASVEFCGVLSHAKIGELMQKSRVFVQHSITTPQNDTEGTPVSIIEACAVGLPVVATRHAGIPDVVKEGVSGILVDEGDINGMANAMLNFAQNAQLASQMGVKGRKIVEEHFTLDKHIGKLSELISEAIRSN